LPPGDEEWTCAIVAAARNGSFSAAANEFNVRQAIVSRRIKEIEDELSVRLNGICPHGMTCGPGRSIAASARGT
jgi:hypothetical protein